MLAEVWNRHTIFILLWPVNIVKGHNKLRRQKLPVFFFQCKAKQNVSYFNLERIHLNFQTTNKEYFYLIIRKYLFCLAEKEMAHLSVRLSDHLMICYVLVYCFCKTAQRNIS